VVIYAAYRACRAIYERCKQTHTKKEQQAASSSNAMQLAQSRAKMQARLEAEGETGESKD